MAETMSSLPVTTDAPLTVKLSESAARAPISSGLLDC